MKTVKILSLIILVFSFQLTCLAETLALWEIGFKVMNSSGQAISMTVYVYTFNSTTRNLDYYTSGSTSTQFGGSGLTETNGFADIGDNNSGQKACWIIKLCRQNKN